MSPHRAPRLTVLAFAVSALLIVGSTPVDAATTIVLQSPRDESTPSGEGANIAWSQNSNKHPRHYDAFLREGAGSPLKVNPPGTVGFAGGFDGDQLIYQRVNRTGSDLRFFDVSTHQQVAAPAGLNTPLWEWSPTFSDPYVLFNRESLSRRGRWTERVTLFDTTTMTSELLVKTEARYPGSSRAGQVNGTWATWERCGGTTCNVFVRDLVGGVTTQLPNPGGKPQYAPSIAADGTVFYVRSGFGCGLNVRIMRNDGGVVTTLATLPSGRDSFDTYTDDSGATPTLWFSRDSCRRDGDIGMITT